MKKIEKIFGSIAVITFVIIYLYLTFSKGLLMPLTALIHIPLLITSILIITSLYAEFKWVNTFFYLTFNTLSMIITAVCMIKFFNSINWNIYVPCISEIITLVVILLFGSAVGVITSFPMKLIQMFFHDTVLYGDEDEKTTKTKTKKVVTTAEKYEITLLNMNETQLQVELNDVLEREEFEKVRAIRKALDRFR